MNLLNQNYWLECVAEARDVWLATMPVATESIIFILLVVTIYSNYLESMLLEVCTTSELFMEVID